MKRRTFIWVSTLASLSVFLPIVSCNSKSTLEKVLSKPIALAMINDRESIIRLGKRYLELVSLELKKEFLINLLLKNKNGKYLFKSSKISVLKQFIQKRIENEFIAGETILINGWILSKTEIRQCAILYLKENKRC